MKMRLMMVAAVVLIASRMFAQTAQTPQPPRTAVAPQAPAAPAAPPPVQAPPPPPPAPPAPPGPRQSINVKVDLNITEDGGGGPPIRKTVSTVAGDGFNGSVRETATVPPNLVPLNFDAYPTILANGKIRLQCTIQYQSAQSREHGNRSSTDIKQNFVLILDSGKPLVATQATDPVSDRKVTVEVTATILK